MRRGDRRRRLLSAASLAMAAGYSAAATIPYRFGAALSLLPRFTPEGMFETIQNHRVTILSALPTAYRKMLQVDRKSTRLNSSHIQKSRMPSSA